MSRYHHPVDPDTDREIRAEVVKRLVERSHRNFEADIEDMPGLKRLPGRERLAFYRQTDDQYWAEYFGTYPDLAKKDLQDWARLSYEHGPLVQLNAG